MQVAPPTANYARWLRRVGSYLIDYIIPGVLSGIGSDFSSGNGTARNTIGAILSFAALIFVVYNRWIRMGRTGQSIGKSLTNTRLISLRTGQPIGAWRAFLRDVCHILDSLVIYIGFLWPLWDRKRQTWADKIMKTVVVYQP